MRRFAVPLTAGMGHDPQAGTGLPGSRTGRNDTPTATGVSRMSQPPKLRILSAGAPKTGVRLCAEAFAAATGTPFTLSFATGPEIRKRVAEGSAKADVIVAPASALEDFAASGAVAAAPVVSLGAVSAGVAVRAGAPAPDISSVDAFRAALLAADALIYNRASSGQHIAAMIEGLGIAQAVADKTLRAQTGAGAMEQLASAEAARAIGFGQITEIRVHEGLGIRLVGPLPEGLGKRTAYSAGISGAAANPDGARGLLAFFASPEGQGRLAQSGVS
ncbi:MAG: substrate-binding domain-containing protein [Paracoccaceae bacterium]